MQLKLRLVCRSPHFSGFFWFPRSCVVTHTKAKLTPYALPRRSGGNEKLAFRTLPIDQAREWIDQLLTDKSQIRTVIKATSALGDPHAINWLIHTMKDPTLAKLAGESFTTITGMDIKTHQLVLDTPDNIVAIDHIDDDNDSADRDDDENPLTPGAEKVAALWCQQSPHYIAGQRYFMGQLIGEKHLKEILANGTQRQRHAAALELALSESDTPLPNTRARILTS